MTAQADDRDQLTVDSIVDMLILSKCDVILKTSSALSCFSKIIHPQVRVLSMSAMRQPWFPATVTHPYVAPPHSTSSVILRRTMQGHIFGGPHILMDVPELESLPSTQLDRSVTHEQTQTTPPR